MTDTVPTKFSDLSVEELRRTAVEDFAVDIKSNANKNTVLAALVEDGVEWEQYATLKGLNAPAPEPVAPVVVEAEVAPEEVVIRTAEPIAPTRTEKYLIKMERKNVRFDVLGHKFTQEHPYALVGAAEADYILTKEKGFRMAFPSELEEFYG